MAYDNTNRGAIWKNEKMRSDKQDPQFTGSLDVEGVEYWVSAWKRKPDAKPGAPALSIAINRKEPKAAGNASGGVPDPEFDDEIPF